MEFKAHHLPYARNARVEYEEYLQRIQKTKHGQSLVDVYFYGTLIRINETLESIFFNATGAPDNTLKILFRHLFENVVRIRYLALNPDSHIKEFELAEIKSRLKIIGHDPQPNESDERSKERERFVAIKNMRIDELKTLYSTADNKNIPDMTFKRMCEMTNDSGIYSVYVLFSQFEHSTGIGLMGTVVDQTERKLVFNSNFDEGKVVPFWKTTERMLVGVEEAIDMLNSKRPTE